MVNTMETAYWILFLGFLAILWTVQYRHELKEIKAYRRGYARGLADGRTQQSITQ